jgi:hypothetical protein
MAEFNVKLADSKVRMSTEVLHKPGAVRLDGYPLLVYAPAQHGEGIRTEDVGASVAEICLALAETPDVAAVAVKFRTTPEHVEQALAYAQAMATATAEPTIAGGE